MSRLFELVLVDVAYVCTLHEKEFDFDFFVS